MSQPTDNSPSRRRMVRGAALAGLGALGGYLASRTQADDMVWQIDPSKCIACDKCATECVLNPSAAKCVHAYAMCGYCRLCTGYFVPDAPELVEAAENAQCPTDAIRRTFVEDPYFEYTIDEELCIGCAKCVKGCTQFGNGSLFMQIRHDRCVNCNECAIAVACPEDAIRRVPASQPYLIKSVQSLPPTKPQEPQA
ncbi:ferredoxin [Planctomycetales bacterium ZRK34]|nr:ferredoxin [Planctomycetales bacterium ZRK34]